MTMKVNYLIEESACKEHERWCRKRMPPKLWKWLRQDGPIIRAQGTLHETTKNVTFVSPFGEVRIPEAVLTEDFNA